MIDLEEMERFEAFLKANYTANTTTLVLGATRSFLQRCEPTAEELQRYSEHKSGKTINGIRVYFRWAGIEIPKPARARKLRPGNAGIANAVLKLRELGRPFTPREARTVTGLSLAAIERVLGKEGVHIYRIRFYDGRGRCKGGPGLKVYSFAELSEDEIDALNTYDPIPRDQITLEPQLFDDEAARLQELQAKRACGVFLINGQFRNLEDEK